MRRSLRFFSNCSSSSVIGIGVLIQQKVVARHAAQNHPFQTVEIVKTVLGSFADRGQEWLARMFFEQAQQLPQGNNRTDLSNSALHQTAFPRLKNHGKSDTGWCKNVLVGSGQK